MGVGSCTLQLKFGRGKIWPRDIYKNRRMLGFTTIPQRYFQLTFFIFPQNQC
jgi:hypothetical protein